MTIQAQQITGKVSLLKRKRSKQSGDKVVALIRKNQ
jgi:hypothetical protein